MCISLFILFYVLDILWYIRFSRNCFSPKEKNIYKYCTFLPHLFLILLMLVYQVCSVSDLWQDLISGCLQHVEQDVQVILPYIISIYVLSTCIYITVKCIDYRVLFMILRDTISYKHLFFVGSSSPSHSCILQRVFHGGWWIPEEGQARSSLRYYMYK